MKILVTIVRLLFIICFVFFSSIIKADWHGGGGGNWHGYNQGAAPSFNNSQQFAHPNNPSFSQPFNNPGQFQQHMYGQPAVASMPNSSGFNWQSQFRHHEYGQTQMNGYYGQGQYGYHAYGQSGNGYYGQQSGYGYYGQSSYHQHPQTHVTIYINGFPWTFYNPYYYPYAASQIWVNADEYGDIPPNAIAYQYVNGSTLYYCRIHIDTGIYEGVFVPGDGCYVQLDDETVRFTNFEVLVSMGY